MQYKIKTSIINKLKKFMENNKDLCKTCKHYWVDFPMPLEVAVSHCEILDAKSINQNMNEIVPYPCVSCPFNRYEKK